MELPILGPHLGSRLKLGRGRPSSMWPWPAASAWPLSTLVFSSVSVQVGYEHYAEAPVTSLPAFLAMPFNSLVNMAYVFLRVYWLRSQARAPGGPAEKWRARYLKDVFAGMALVYGRSSGCALGCRHGPALCWTSGSLYPSSRGRWPLVPLPGRGLEAPAPPWLAEASPCAVTAWPCCTPVGSSWRWACTLQLPWAGALRTQVHHGNSSSGMYLALACSCLGFVVLKLCDHELAQWHLFQQLTGHFWSKVCDRASVPLCLPVPDQLTYLPKVPTCRRCVQVWEEGAP